MFFAAHGITRIDRAVTDNGNDYRARDFTRAVVSLTTRRQRIRPYTPTHNGKVERFNRPMVDEALCVRPSEADRCQASKARAVIGRLVSAEG